MVLVQDGMTWNEMTEKTYATSGRTERIFLGLFDLDGISGKFGGIEWSWNDSVGTDGEERLPRTRMNILLRYDASKMAAKRYIRRCGSYKMEE